MEKDTNNLQQVGLMLLDLCKPLIDESVRKALAEQKEKDIQERPPELWNKNQTAKYLKVSFNTLQKFIRDGVVRPIKIGSRERFNADQIKKEVYDIRSHLYSR